MKTPMERLIAKLHKISELHVDDTAEELEYKVGLRTAAVIAEMYYNETFNTNEK